MKIYTWLSQAPPALGHARQRWTPARPVSHCAYALAMSACAVLQQFSHITRADLWAAHLCDLAALQPVAQQVEHVGRQLVRQPVHELQRHHHQLLFAAIHERLQEGSTSHHIITVCQSTSTNMTAAARVHGHTGSESWSAELGPTSLQTEGSPATRWTTSSVRLGSLPPRPPRTTTTFHAHAECCMAPYGMCLDKWLHYKVA